MQLGMIL